MLEVVYGAGLRRRELASLELGDLDLGLGLVRLRQTKNGLDRTVPLTWWALHYLQRYLQEARPKLASPLSSNALWLNPSGKAMHCEELGRRLRRFYRVQKMLGFEMGLHDLRHAFASHLLCGGASVRDVQELLGHKKIDNTAIYTHLSARGVMRQHRKCHPRNRPGFFDNPVE